MKIKSIIFVLFLLTFFTCVTNAEPVEQEQVVTYLSLINGDQPIPNDFGLNPKNPSFQWTSWIGSCSAYAYLDHNFAKLRQVLSLKFDRRQIP